MGYVSGYFEAGSDDLKKDFEKAASALREEYKFGHTTNEEVLAAAGVKKLVMLVLFCFIGAIARFQ